MDQAAQFIAVNRDPLSTAAAAAAAATARPQLSVYTPHTNVGEVAESSRQTPRNGRYLE